MGPYQWSSAVLFPDARIFPMPTELSGIPAFDDDPVIRLLLGGQARTLQEAEQMYLDNCLPEVVRLLQSPLTDEELGNHPLMVMLRRHGSRGHEDSLL
jgi:hypothetical protein